VAFFKVTGDDRSAKLEKKASMITHHLPAVRTAPGRDVKPRVMAAAAGSRRKGVNLVLEPASKVSGKGSGNGNGARDQMDAEYEKY